MTHERDRDRDLERHHAPKREPAQDWRKQIAPGKISTSSLMRPPPPRDKEACDEMQALGAQMIRALNKPAELDAVLTQMEALAARYRPQVPPELAQELVPGRRVHVMPGSQIAPGRLSVTGLMSQPETRAEHEAARERYGVGCHDDILLYVPADVAPGRMSVSSYLRRPSNPIPSALARSQTPAPNSPHQDEARADATAATPAPPERLPQTVRDRMEHHFGTTFTEVELRTNSPEVAGSKAHARGNEVHFAAGYQPGTVEGDRILAHELAHVVQLRGGGRPGTRAELEAEADRAASQLAHGERVRIELSAPAGVYTHTEGGQGAPAASNDVPARGSYLVELVGSSYRLVFNTFDRNHWREPVLTGLRYYMHQVFPGAGDAVIRAVLGDLKVRLDGNGSTNLPIDRRYELTVDPKFHERVVAWMSAHHPEFTPHAPQPGIGALRSVDIGHTTEHTSHGNHAPEGGAGALAADAAHAHVRAGATRAPGAKADTEHGEPAADAHGWRRWVPKGELRLQPPQPTYVAGSTVNAELAWDLSVHPDAGQVLLPQHCTYAWTVHRGGKLVDSGGHSLFKDDRRAELQLGQEPGTYEIAVNAMSPHFKAARRCFSSKTIVRVVSEEAFDRAAFDAAQVAGADAAFTRDAHGSLHLRPGQNARTTRDEIGGLDVARGGIDALASQGKITGEDRDTAAGELEKQRAELMKIEEQVAGGTPYVVRGTFVSREDSSTTPLQLMLHVLRRVESGYDVVLHDTTFGEPARYPGSASGHVDPAAPKASYAMLEAEALEQMAAYFQAHNEYPRGTVHLAAQRLAGSAVWEKTLNTDNGRKTAKRILAGAALIGGAAMMIVPGGTVVSAGLLVVTSSAGIASVGLELEGQLARDQLQLDRRLVMDVLQVAAIALPFGTLTRTFATASQVGKTGFALCMVGLDTAQGFVISMEVKRQLSVIEANTAVELAAAVNDEQRKAIRAERDRRVAEMIGGAVVNGGFLLVSLGGGIKQTVAITRKGAAFTVREPIRDLATDGDGAKERALSTGTFEHDGQSIALTPDERRFLEQEIDARNMLEGTAGPKHTTDDSTRGALAGTSNGPAPSNQDEHAQAPGEPQLDVEPAPTNDTEVKGSQLPEFPLSLQQVRADINKDEPGEYFEVAFQGTTSTGKSMRLGSGAVNLDENGLPQGSPSFTLEARYCHNDKAHAIKLYHSTASRADSDVPVGIGERTPLTAYAIQMFNKRYKAKFGHEPEEFFGVLSDENLLHYQREYSKLIQNGTEPEVAAVEAIERISFGIHRIRAGYTELTVITRAERAVNLGELGLQSVPTVVIVTARRP